MTTADRITKLVADVHRVFDRNDRRRGIMFKCVSSLTNKIDGRDVCGADADQLFQGSTLCGAHLSEAINRAEVAGSFGGMLKAFEKVTLDDVAKISAMIRPLMAAFSASMAAGVTATPGVCNVTPGCLLLGGHVSNCSSVPPPVNP